MGRRWIIDAMNVIGSRPDGWWRNRDEAMRSFACRIDEHARTTTRDITVVFDTDPGRLPDSSLVRIVIARGRGRNAADQEIERLVAEAEDAADLRVVTSDRDLAGRVTEAGAVAVSSGSFRAELDR